MSYESIMTVKPEKRQDSFEVVYNSERWALFSQFRQKARHLLDVLQKGHIDAFVHGSVARGDVQWKSDVDAFIPDAPSSFRVETVLEQAKISAVARRVVQATPVYAMKGYIEIDESTTVSFPLMPLRRVEREFYKFSGKVSLGQIEGGARVLGVDKRLMFIQPTERGHSESGIVGREEEVAKSLGVAVETVLDRVRALMKRDEVGRTGVFLKRELNSGETFEMALNRLAAENPAVRRRLKRRV